MAGLRVPPVQKVSMLRDKTGIQQRLWALLGDNRGATAIEYGLIIALISGAMILGLESVRDNLLAIFQVIADTLAGAIA